MVSICGTHAPGSMRFPQPIRAGRTGRSALAIALTAYFLLFSSAALVHVYAQNELIDPHGCAIGTWVQHASATDSEAPPLATLVCLNEFLQSTHDTIPQATVPGYASRGPPLRFS